VQTGERDVEEALRRAQRGDSDRRQRLRWTTSTAASYALDAAFVAAYVAAGTIGPGVLLWFVAGAAAICAATAALYASGWNLRLRDQSAIAPQVVAGIALHLGLVAAAPQAAFPLLANLFTVFAFGFIWLSLRASLTLWALSMAATGAVLWAVHGHAGIAVSTPFEAAVTWLSFSAVLARFLVLSVFANQMRARLADGRRKLAASLEQIRELVHYDELTKVYNRRTLMERLEQERSRAERTGITFCVALTDLDHFKAINDAHGHAAGDEVLRTYAGAVQNRMREVDVFGRYGGEEFMLIFSGTGSDGVGAPLGRIRAALAAQDWGRIASGLDVRHSVGVAGFHRGESAAQLLKRADDALYEAKRAGRDRVIVRD
jgi:diguanylate cyclase